MDCHKLIVDSVVVRFGEKTVLTGGYITSSTGKVTGLLGRNGAGKSCMFRALMGGLRVENVMVSIDGNPVDRKTIGKYIKYLPQGRMMPEGIRLNRAFKLYGLDYWDFVSRFPKYSRFYDSYAWELSGGEARLAELYMVLMSDAISSVADDLFVIADGYTFPVSSRDDLVRHGYLRP